MTDIGAAGELRWQPRAQRRALELRADLNRLIRSFFLARGVLEVETPLIQRAANPDPAVEPLEAGSVGARGFLRTSPEFALKRLLCAGSGPVYELGRVFRAGESGRRHHPEFTMLEWYRPGFSLEQLMDEVAELVNEVMRSAGLTRLPIVRLRYHELLQSLLRQPLPSEPAALQAACVEFGPMDPATADRLTPQECEDLLFAVAGDALPRAQLTFVSHFPAAQAALARLDPAEPSLALRFEAFAGGMELANGYDELRSAQQLGERFAWDNRRREKAGLTVLPVDERLLAAQGSGLPACSGVSVGVDRLLMLAGGYEHLHEVLTFPEESL